MKDLLIGALIGFMLAVLGVVASELIDAQDDITRQENQIKALDYRVDKLEEKWVSAMRPQTES